MVAGLGQTMLGYIFDADGNRVAKGTISSWSCDTATNGFQVTSTYALDLEGQTVTEMPTATALVPGSTPICLPTGS